MREQLNLLAEVLPGLPGSSLAHAQRFASACADIRLRLKQSLADLVQRKTRDAAEALGILRSLAGQGSTAAVLGRRLAAGGEGGSIAAAVSLWGMASIAGGVLRALQVVGGRPEAAEGGWPPGLSGQEVDGLLAWPSAVLLSTRTVLMAAGPRASGAAPSLAKCVLDASYLALQQCMLPSRQSAPNAAALQQARSQVPALLHALAWTASRLPLMGNEECDAEEWFRLMETLGVLVAADEYEAAAAAALAAGISPRGGTCGTQLADTMLTFLASLPRAGLPASCCAAQAVPEAAAQAGGPAGTDWTLGCHDILSRLLQCDAFVPYVLAAAARSPHSVHLVGALGLLLGQLRQQQEQQAQQAAQQAHGQPAAPQEQGVARAWLVVGASMCACIGTVLAGHCLALGRLAPALQAAMQQQQGQRDDPVVQAACSGATSAALAALQTFPDAAAVLAAAVGPAGCEAVKQTLCLLSFTMLVTNTGSVLLELSQLGVYQLDTRGAHVLLTAAEAALRRAPTLQRALPVAVAQTDVVHSAACSCGNCLLFCLGWARTARQPLETAEAESLLGAFSSLATTACKLAAAGAGARQSNSGSLGTNGSLVGGLLDILCHCEELAELAVELCATPPERCGRLLRCVRLQRAEANALLLPVCLPTAQRHWEQGGLPATAPLAQQEGQEAAASLRALAATRRCCHMGCTALTGGSETELPTKRCSGCRVARFCSAACSAAAWRAGHKHVCRQLAAAEAQAVSAPEEQQGVA